MHDLIIFTVKNNRYGLDLEGVQRVIQSPELTPYPNAHPLVEGMFAYERQVIKVLSFRKMTGLELCEQELKRRFDGFSDELASWLESVKQAAMNDHAFKGSLRYEECGLGRWLGGFTSHDAKTTELLKELAKRHRGLYATAAGLLAQHAADAEKKAQAVDGLATELRELQKTMGRFVADAQRVCNSLQKLLLFRGKQGHFAIKVDDIVDIAHIDEAQIKRSDATYVKSEFLELEGVLDLNGTLINIIKSVRMPVSEVA